MQVLIKTFHGMEEVLAKEVQAILGRPSEARKRAVYVDQVTPLELYRLNKQLRTALRVLVNTETFTVHSYEDIYKALRTIKWEELFYHHNTISIDSTVFSPYFKNSQFVMHKSKDAIVDHFRDLYGKRPSVERKNANIRINIHITERQMIVSLDSSGESLHRRGYKQVKVKAPINEVLAAGLIQLSDWDQQTAFWDPMCGSGTIVTEAALLKYNIQSQFKRDEFCFRYWKTFDKKIWQELKREKSSPETLPSPILGSDIDRDVIFDFEKELRSNKLQSQIDIKKQNFFQIEEQIEPRLLIFNPPYNKRLGLEDAKGFYKMIGDTLKQKCKGSTAWVFSGDKEAIKFVGLRPSKKIILYNGPIESRFHKFELF